MTTPSITFISCIEAGGLEQQVLYLGESLRRWGGAFKECPIFAYQVRKGPPLQRETLLQLEQLGIRYIRKEQEKKFSWHGPLNKAKALLFAQDDAITEQLCWLDSDILVVGEPAELWLDKEEDFCACSVNKDIASRGFHDPDDLIFQHLCKLFSISIDMIPWVVTERCRQQIRAYWNGGVFTVRRESRFGEMFLNACYHILQNRVAKPRSRGGFFWTDELALPMLVVGQQLRWRGLSQSHNTPISFPSNNVATDEELRAAKILHYHRAMSPENWSRLLQVLSPLSEVVEWLSYKEKISPVGKRSPAMVRNKIWQLTRKIRKYFFEISYKNRYL